MKNETIFLILYTIFILIAREPMENFGRKIGEFLKEKFSTEKQLKPCPFCGYEGRLVKNCISTYFVECPNEKCKVRLTTLPQDTAKEAIKAWNKRYWEAKK